MMYSHVENFRKELEFISRRLGGLAASCENAAWLSDADQALVHKVEREKDRLALRLSEAERIGNWDRIKEHFAGEWNKFIMDLEQLELRVEVEHPENAKT